MKRDEIRKLVGGYATGTLSDAERKELFAAALDDQKLFDALADEEALRELLDDPAYRRELSAALADTDASLGEKLRAWWKRPLPLALAGAVVTLAVALVVVLQPEQPATEVAMTRNPDAPASEPTARWESAAPPEEAGVGSREGGATEGAEPEPAMALMSRRDRAAERDEEEREAPGRQAPPREGASAAPTPEASGEVGEHKAGQSLADADESRVRAKEEAEQRRARALAVSAEAQRRTPTAVAVPAPASPLAFGLRSAIGLTVTVERRSPEGTFVEVRSGTRVDPTAVLRLRVHAPEAGYVYVREQSSDGAWRLIFTGEAQPGTALHAPPAGGLAPHPSGAERRLEVVFSPDPLPVDALESGVVLPFDESLERIDVLIEYTQ